MKSRHHYIIRISVILIALGIVILGAVLAVNRFELTSLLQNQKWVRSEKSFADASDSVQCIEIDAAEADVQLLAAEDNVLHLVCNEMEPNSCSAEINGDTLTLHWTRAWKWQDIFDFSFGAPKLTLYVPKDLRAQIRIHSESGDIGIEGIGANQLEITSKSGNLQVQGAEMDQLYAQSQSGDIHLAHFQSSKEVQAETASGNIRIEDGYVPSLDSHSGSGDQALKALRLDNLSATSTSGDQKLSDVHAQVRMDVQTTSGNISLETVDGEALFMQTDSGDIHGSLATGKRFSASSGSGNVYIPESSDNAGTFEARSSSGDIRIDLP